MHQRMSLATEQDFPLPVLPRTARWRPNSLSGSTVVGELDLSAIYADYRSRRGGRPAYDPQMMVSLLLYGYCVGIASSRKIERATYEQVPFRVLAANQHPDHDTICTFRGRHLEAQARQEQGEEDDKEENRLPEATGQPPPEPDDRA